MKPANIKAIDDTIEVWEYLRDNPEISRKIDLPERLYGKIRKKAYECPLCELYRNDYAQIDRWSVSERVIKNAVCGECPLYKEKCCCSNDSSPYSKWKCSSSEETIGKTPIEVRKQAATRLVNALKRFKGKRGI